MSNVETISTQTEASKPAITVVQDRSLDQQVEDLIRSHKELSVTRHRNGKINLQSGPDPAGLEILPKSTKERLEKAGVDISVGYPEIPPKDEIPIFVDQAHAIRDYDVEFIERGKNADPEKKALFSAAKEVINLTKNVGTEIVGLQLSDLTDQQKDELALLIAERVVVFFKDQDLSPQEQLKLGKYYGNVEVHPQAPHVPGLPGTSVIWSDYYQNRGLKLNFANNNLGNWDSKKFPAVGTQVWHTDLVHERQPAGYTHLHLDAIPDVGGDTMWASGYGAYDKLSDEFKQFLDGKEAVYVSAHGYLNRDDVFGGPQRIERTHPLVRTHPATGWKYLSVNRVMTKRIVGLSPVESDLILNYLFDVYEKNADLQVRFKWKNKDQKHGTSAIWDNRVSQHRSVWDFEGESERHGTRVTSLSGKPYFDPNSKSQRESLGKYLHQWN